MRCIELTSVFTKKKITDAWVDEAGGEPGGFALEEKKGRLHDTTRDCYG